MDPRLNRALATSVRSVRMQPTSRTGARPRARAPSATVLDPRGEEHTAETIDERLSVRDFMDLARLSGIVTGGPPPYDARAKQAFAAALDRALTRLRGNR